ncbi:terminase B [Aneurinibacillus thermoaerophilus]|uniref:terminase B n=1 Tax=Aneurinibacillus thermoaerophilus TaxID=143495 RepID=UPI002E23742B|nr:terminase B [Aneurinibacillus thermoaerophilus]
MSDLVSQEDLVEAIALYYDNPVSFAEDILKVKPDPDQAKIMQSVAQNRLTSVRAGHGVGKSALTSWIILWFLFTRPFPKVPCTAPKESQLFDILWAEIAKWLRNSLIKDFLQWTQTKVSMIGYSEDWFAVARTSRQPENLAGFHAEHMLYVVDEASGVADENFEVIMGALSGENNKLLMIGNPTRTSGFFFDSHNKDRALFATHHIDGEKSPRVSAETIEFFKKKYGENSNAYKIRVKGEFPDGEDDAFISLHDTLQAVNREGVEESGAVELGVDVARFGDDETVIATRIGMKVLPLQIYNKQDLMVTTGYVMKTVKPLVQRYGRVKIKIDDTGLGGGVTDRLNEIIREERLNAEVIPINFAEGGNEDYDDIISEMYGYFKENVLDECSLPDDEDLIAQLSVRKYTITSKGRIKLESKKEMKKRGVKSPDRAEAVVMAFFQPKIELPKFAVSPIIGGIKRG